MILRLSYNLPGIYDEGHKELVQYLLSKNMGKSEYTMLDHAILAHDREILNRLFDLGFKVRVFNNNELFFYQEAAAAHATNVFDALLQQGLAPAPQDLQFFTEKGYLRELELLMEKFPVEKPVLMDLIARAGRANQKETYAFLVSKLSRESS